MADAAPTQEYDEEEYIQLVSTCLQLADMGMVDSFDEIFNALQGVAAQRVEIKLLTGIQQRMRGQYEDAIVTLSEVAEEAPEFPLVHYHLGLIRGMLGDDIAAIKHYTDCTALDIYFVEANLELARITHRMGNLVDAVDLAVHAVSQAPNNMRLWSLISEMLKGAALKSRVMRLEEALTVAMREKYVKARDVMTPTMLSFRLVPMVKTLLGTPADEMDGAVENALQDQVLLAGVTEPFVMEVLHNITLCDVECELVLRSIRRCLLINANVLDETSVSLAFALAHYCFNNEYVFYVSEEERAVLAALEKEILGLQAGAGLDEEGVAKLAIYAAYKPLYECENREVLSKLIEASNHKALMNLAKRSIDEVSKERSYLDKVVEFAPVEDASSQEEKAQYEQYPYPRWTTPTQAQVMSFRTAVKAQMPFLRQEQLPTIQSNDNAPFDVLVAGCGTGQHPFIVSNTFPMANVFAMDFSKTCLAYAQMKQEEFGYQNVEFSQGDILDLGKLGRQFDYVECIGVLHHVPKIEEAFQALADATKPGGWLKIALYDYDKRSYVRDGWEFIQENGYGSSKDDIRQVRYDLMRNRENIGSLTPLLRSTEFYTMSDCNGLMYHIGEHQMALDELRKIINKTGLRFMGMLVNDINGIEKLTEGNAAITNWQSMKQWEVAQKAKPEHFHHMHMMMLQKPS